MVTDPQTNKQTNTATNPQTGPITIHCAGKLSVQCKKMNSNENNLLHCQGTDGKVLDKYLAESTACNESSTAASSCRELSNSAVSNMALATQASTLYTLRSRSERNVGDTLNCSGTSGCTPLVNKLSTASSGHRAARYWHSSCPTARELTPPTYNVTGIIITILL